MVGQEADAGNPVLLHPRAEAAGSVIVDMDPGEDVEQAALRLKTVYQARFGTAVAQLNKLDESSVHMVSARLASQLHENWVVGHIASRRTGEGPDDFEPRWKHVGDDRDWLKAAQVNPYFQRTLRQNPETYKYEVDIARIPFESLPNNPWVIDNNTAAIQSVVLVHYAIATNKPLDSKFLESASGEVHNMWAYRHPDVKQTAEDPGEEEARAIQRLLYDDPDFTEVERNKDREHVVLAAEMYASVSRQLLAPETSRRHYEFALGRVRNVASKVGALLSRRSVAAPKTPEIERQLDQPIIELTTSVHELVAGWQESHIAITDSGNIVRTYNPQPDSAPLTARLVYEGPGFQTVIGAELEHSHFPYSTFFYTNLRPDQGKGSAAIYFGEEHRYAPPGSLHSEVNNDAAVKCAQDLLQQARNVIEAAH